jgi:hypothetical protein
LAAWKSYPMTCRSTWTVGKQTCFREPLIIIPEQ